MTAKIQELAFEMSLRLSRMQNDLQLLLQLIEQTPTSFDPDTFEYELDPELVEYAHGGK